MSHTSLQPPTQTMCGPWDEHPFGRDITNASIPVTDTRMVAGTLATRTNPP